MVKGVVRADFYEDSRTRPRKHFTILSANNISYIIKTRNLTATGIGNTNTRTRAGSFGVNTNSSYEYKIYVKKSDLEQAKYLIR